MKSLYKLVIVVLLMAIILPSCKKDNHELNTNVNAVTQLTAPDNNSSFNLKAGGGNIIFQWGATSTADPVLYEVAFDKSTGDFSHPIYKMLSDGRGVETQASISQDTLNRVAELAGIAPLNTGTLKWTVIVSLAANAKLSTAQRTISVTRPIVLPTTLYLTGSAAEGGKTIPMKQTSVGVFELYTSLQAGSYQLTDKSDGTGSKYYIDAQGALNVGNSTTAVTGATKAYRIDVNLNTLTTNIVGIDSIGLYMSAYNTSIGKLSYVGNGTWENPKIPVTFYQFSWGRDQRYKFILHTSAGDEWWGSTLANNVDPAGQPASYFYLVPATNDQWNNTYKFPAAADMHNVKVDVYFQASGPYTHTATAFN
ncbi:MAG: SusE domain-containing protein [Mucilaginibacter sp.]